MDQTLADLASPVDSILQWHIASLNLSWQPMNFFIASSDCWAEYSHTLALAQTEPVVAKVGAAPAPTYANTLGKAAKFTQPSSHPALRPIHNCIRAIGTTDHHEFLRSQCCCHITQCDSAWANTFDKREFP